MLDKRFSGFDNFIFDLDGTVWYWTELIPKATQVFQVLRRYEKNVLFVTNNTLLTREGLAKKLQNFGIEAVRKQILNPAITAINLFQGKRVFCLGEGIITDLRSAKIKVVDSKPDVVSICNDRMLTYEKLAKACDFVNTGTKLYKDAAGGVWFYGKKRMPGSGAIAAAVENCCGKSAELYGKPSAHMIKIIRLLNLKPDKTVWFGDECDSDIVMGNKLGFKTALVLTGRDSEKDYLSAKGDFEPKMVIKSIASILK